MSFKKKVLAALLAITLTTAFCGQALVANQTGIAFPDGSVVAIAGEDQAQLVMLDGELLPALAYTDGYSISLPFRAIVEALNGTYTETNGVVQAINMTIQETALPNVISINGLFYDLGADVKRIGNELFLPVPAIGFVLEETSVDGVLGINGRYFQVPAGFMQMLRALYAPSGGTVSLSITTAAVSPVDMPIVLIETKTPAEEPLLVNPLGYRDLLIGKIKAVNTIALAQSHQNEAGFVMSDFIGAKAAIVDGIGSSSYVGEMSHYYIFDAGNFNAVVNKYTGDFFFASGGTIMTLEEGYLPQLLVEPPEVVRRATLGS